jgi:hypothetical protein
MRNPPHKFFYRIADAIFIVPLAGFLALVIKQGLDVFTWLQTGAWPHYSAAMMIRDLKLPLPVWTESNGLVSWFLAWPADVMTFIAVLIAWIVVALLWMWLCEAIAAMVGWARTPKRKAV